MALPYVPSRNSNNRYRSGDTKATRSDKLTPNTVAVHKGDLVAVAPAAHQIGGVATNFDGQPIPADQMGQIGGGTPDFATVALARVAFKAAFLGVNQVKAPDGHPQKIVVSARGRYQYPMDAASYSAGDLLAPFYDGVAGGQLDAQKLAKVTVVAEAIMIVREGMDGVLDDGIGVEAEVISTVLERGVQNTI